MAEEYSTNGLLRQLVAQGASGAAVGVGAPDDVAYSDADGSSDGTLVAIDKGQYVLTAAMSAKLPASLGIKTAANSLSIAPASDATFVTIGNVASGVADAGAPLKTGRIYVAGALVAVATGQRVDDKADSYGNSRVLLTTYVQAHADAIPNASTAFVQTASSASNTANLLAVIPSYFNGSTNDRVRGDTNGLVTQPHALSASRWGYASATGGIVNTTTAVTLIAATASVRNYITALQIDWDALGAATEVAIRDGAGGTVLWRMKIQGSAAGARDIVFPVPLKGTVNTLLEVVTLTASVTGGVFVNAQGFQGV